jgi:hypothetical protein
VSFNATASFNARFQRLPIPPVTHQWSFTTGAPNPSGAWPGLYPSGVVDPSATPRILEAYLTHTRFRVARHRTALSAAKRGAPPRGSTINVVLSEPANVEIVVARPVLGRRRSRGCVPVMPMQPRSRARACTRLVAIGTLQRRTRPAGMSSISFSGRLGFRPLRPGPYRVLVAAWRGSHRSIRVSLPFTIVP